MTDDQLLAGKHILIVEDEMLVLMAIEDMMSDLGAESVTAAATVEQALNFISARHFDFATLDVNLAGVRSNPVADALGADNVPFAFSTGYGNHAMENAYGNQLVLRKPYNRGGLTQIVNQLFPS